jgi:DNA-binding transcriptional ArsR family regulator
MDEVDTSNSDDSDAYHETDFHGSRVEQPRRVRRPDEEAFEIAGEPPREENHETDFHGSPVGQSRRVREPLEGTVRIAGERRSVETVVEVERLRRTYSSEFRVLMEAIGEPTRRGVLAALLDASPRTYKELDEWTGTTTRTIKNHVSDLSDAGIVEVEDGRPATIAFRNDDLRLLSSDVLSFL